MKQEPKIYFSYKTKTGMSKYLKWTTKQRIASLLASTPFQKRFLKGTLRVVYGKAKCASGCICIHDNEIEGNLADMKWGLKAFLDKDLWNET